MFDAGPVFFMVKFKNKNQSSISEGSESGDDLVDFFRLLLQSDKRINPRMYENGPDSIVSYQDNNY